MTGGEKRTRGRPKGSLSKATRESGKRTRASIKAGFHLPGRPGRPYGTVGKLGKAGEDIQQVAYDYVRAGAAPNAASIAALTEAKGDRSLFEQAEVALSLNDWEKHPPYCIEEGAEGSVPPPSAEELKQVRDFHESLFEENPNNDPGYEMNDDGFPDRWISPAFSRRGKPLLKELGVAVVDHHEFAVESMARRLRRLTKSK